MVVLYYCYKKYFLKICHYYNYDKYVSQTNADINFYHNLKKHNLAHFSKRRNIIIQKQYTLINDLTLPLDSIWFNIKKNYQYEIKRSEKNNNTNYLIITEINNDLNKSYLEEFKKQYNAMFVNKNLKLRFNDKLIKALFDNNYIIVTVGLYENKPLVFHATIVYETKSILIYSTSFKSNNKNEMANIGRINKYLHWKDYIYLKSKGIEVYDWGGINSATDPNGIAKFKLGFGGLPVKYFSIIYAKSMIGKIVLFVYKLMMI